MAFEEKEGLEEGRMSAGETDEEDMLPIGELAS